MQVLPHKNGYSTLAIDAVLCSFIRDICQHTVKISDLLQKRNRDPRLTNVTVTGVTVSPNLKAATVFFSSLGDRESCDTALEALQHAERFIRRELAQRLAMRYTPKLDFVLDRSWERGAHIDKLLEQLPSSASSDGAADFDRVEHSQ